MKRTIYMMRHGQTLFNQRRKVQGWSDAPLTEMGIGQAKIAGQYFKDNKITFDSAYSSTSERAEDTLELVTNMPYTRLKGLKEWNFGTFEGESEDLNPALPYRDFFVQYGGESEIDFRTRLVQTMSMIMKEDKGETILIVSHGAACAQFARAWEKYSKVGPVVGFRNCAILKFEYEDGIFELQEMINHDFSSLEK